MFGEYEGNDEDDDDDDGEDDEDDEDDDMGNTHIYSVDGKKRNDEDYDGNSYNYPNRDGNSRRDKQGQKRWDRNNGMEEENGRRRKKHRGDRKSRPEKSKSTFGNSSKIKFYKI